MYIGIKIVFCHRNISDLVVQVVSKTSTKYDKVKEQGGLEHLSTNYLVNICPKWKRQRFAQVIENYT